MVWAPRLAISQPLLRRTLLESDRFRDVSRGNDLDRVPGADPQSAPYLSSLDEFMRIVNDEHVPVYAQMPRWARMTTDPADIVVVANNVSMPRCARAVPRRGACVHAQWGDAYRDDDAWAGFTGSRDGTVKPCLC